MLTHEDVKENKVHCVFCISRALYDTVNFAIDFLPEISSSIHDSKKFLNPAIPEEFAAGGLVSIAENSGADLFNHLFNKDISLQVWAGLIRVQIESLANLNFCFNEPSKTTKRLTSFQAVYINSTYDIVKICEAENYSNLSLQWRKEVWSRSSLEDRISLLGDKYSVIYGYSSRLVHGINRDALLKDEADSLIVRFYLYIASQQAKINVFEKLGEPWLDANLKNKVEVVNDLITQTWKTKDLDIENLLMLTTFYDNGLNSVQKKEALNYRSQMVNAFTRGSLPYYELSGKACH